MKFKEISMGDFFVIIGEKRSPLFHQEGGDAILTGRSGFEEVGPYRIKMLNGGGYSMDDKPSKIPPDTLVQLVNDYFNY